MCLTKKVGQFREKREELYQMDKDVFVMGDGALWPWCFIALRLEDEPLTEMSVELEGTARRLNVLHLRYSIPNSLSRGWGGGVGVGGQ